MKREQVFKEISKERSYQNHLCALKNITQNPTLEGELIMLNYYTNKVHSKWVKNATNEEVLGEIRKIASLAVRCLENHGCPSRNNNDILTDIYER